MSQRDRGVPAALAMTFVLAACVGPTASSAGAAWTVLTVVDGDTLDVRAESGLVERVRLIGIDAPEVGECGFDPATERMASLVLDRAVRLVPGAQDDRDPYGRLLRYVDIEGNDAGLQLLKAGLAIARYDSRDGYGRHDREDEYVASSQRGVNGCERGTEIEAGPPETEDASSVESFANCAELNAVHPGGVARTGVTGDTRSGRLEPFGTPPLFDDELYAANVARDGDGDGIACEQR